MEGVLTLSCPDRPGIVYAVSGFLARRGANIETSQQFGDPESGRFFMRVAFEDSAEDLDEVRSGFAAVGSDLAADWQVHDPAQPVRALLMVSGHGHCLNDLLYRQRVGGINAVFPAVVSNHEALEPLASSAGIPFHHVPVTPDTKPQAEAELLRVVDELDVDLVVLARYMQVLSDDLCRQLSGRAINIHHSFLPSFKGARPYHQAHDRGVKIIGATAHYVTADLDEGPIIEQDVERVDHTLSADQFVAVGRDVESRVLARAVGWHCDHRVLLNGSRTVVFR